MTSIQAALTGNGWRLTPLSRESEAVSPRS